MMKKLGLFIIVMGLVIACAVPALAYLGDDGKGNKFMLGGVYMTDVNLWSRSKEMTGTGTDQTQFYVAVPQHSKFNGFIEAGNAGAFWEFGMGYYATGTWGSGAGDTANVSTRKLYGYYRFGNCYFEAGKNDGWLGGYVPVGQRLGLSQELHVFGYGFGSNYDGRWANVRFRQEVSKVFAYQVAIVSPTTAVENIGPAAAARTSYSTFPILAAKIDLNFGVVALQPGAYFAQMKWDGVQSGYDDNFTSWIVQLPVKVIAGPFTGTFQAAYGQNTSNALGSPYNFYQQYARYNGAIKNTTALNGFVDLAVTFGPVTPHIYFGYDRAQNTDAWGKTGGDDNNTKLMYGISAMYMVTPNFGISPEFTFYDWGKRPGGYANGVAGNPTSTWDGAKEWIGGVQFVFMF